MNWMRLDVEGGRTAFRPGETLSGTLQWEFEDEPRSVEVRLFWYTRGKGTQDVAIVDRVSFEAPASSGRFPFRFTLPDQPCSFSGRLISLAWGIEAVGEPEGPVERAEITVSPTGKEILIDRAAGEEA